MFCSFIDGIEYSLQFAKRIINGGFCDKICQFLSHATTAARKKFCHLRCLMVLLNSCAMIAQSGCPTLCNINHDHEKFDCIDGLFDNSTLIKLIFNDSVMIESMRKLTFEKIQHRKILLMGLKIVILGNLFDSIYNDQMYTLVLWIS